MEKLIQQGDVLFFTQEKLPEGLKKVKADPRGVVFAEGEATGHYHGCALDEFIEAYTDADDQMWAKLAAPKEVTHQEHGTVKLAPGIYKIGIVQEIDPFTEEIEKVRD